MPISVAADVCELMLSVDLLKTKKYYYPVVVNIRFRFSPVVKLNKNAQEWFLEYFSNKKIQ